MTGTKKSAHFGGKWYSPPPPPPPPPPCGVYSSPNLHRQPSKGHLIHNKTQPRLIQIIVVKCWNSLSCAIHRQLKGQENITSYQRALIGLVTRSDELKVLDKQAEWPVTITRSLSVNSKP